jgi:hypothetical protein
VIFLYWLFTHSQTDRQRSSTEGAPALVIHSVGESFTVGYWTYCVNSVDSQAWLPDMGQMKACDSGNCVVIDLTVRNDDTTSSTRPVVTLVDGAGRDFSETDTWSNTQLSQLQQLNPGVSKRGYIYFDAPRGSYRLKVSGGYTSGVDALVNLMTAERSAEARSPTLQPYAPPIQYSPSAQAPVEAPVPSIPPVQYAPSVAPSSTESSKATPAPLTVETQSAADPSQLQFEAGVRLVISLNSITRRPDGSFTFRGTLLLPVTLTGAVSLDPSTKLFGSGAANGRTASVTGFTVNGENYELLAANGSSKQPGSGPAVQLDPGKVLEMWFTSASVYEKTTGARTQP